MDLETLIAERDISRAIHRFARAMDERDWAALDTVLLEDATADLGMGLVRGRGAIVAFIRTFLDDCGPTQHLLGTMDIEVHGDTATASTYLEAIHIGIKPGFEGGRMTVWGEYRDQLVRTPEGWRIRHRELVPVHAEGDIGIGS